nr:chaperone protein ClpB3, chloroplastic-like [Tanacetum cinerariifolium]
MQPRLIANGFRFDKVMERKGGNKRPWLVNKAVRHLKEICVVNHDKETCVNVEIVVRCRPVNADEKKLHMPVVIMCAETKREMCAVKTVAYKQNLQFAFYKFNLLKHALNDEKRVLISFLRLQFAVAIFGTWILRFSQITYQIFQQEFTEMAWQTIISSLEVAKENKHQIVETEHLLKVMLEQKNGLGREYSPGLVWSIITRILKATDKFIHRQPKLAQCWILKLLWVVWDC